MIVPDVNLLVHAYDRGSPRHGRAVRWWADRLDDSLIGLPWAVIFGYVRVLTHPRAVHRPVHHGVALNDVRRWLELPSVSVITPGRRHIDIVGQLLEQAGVAGALVPDAQLAALAIEHNAELHSADNDFARFSGLRWVNPLAPR